MSNKTIDVSRGKKIVLVTGSTKGIGFAIAKRLSEVGYIVILNGRTKFDLDVACKNIEGASGFVADMTHISDVKRLVASVLKKFGKLDALVCNVGCGKSVVPGNEIFSEWKKSFNINFFSATNVIEVAKESLVKTKGSIVVISSICGIELIQNAPVTYSTAKAALNAYVKFISDAFGKSGVRINVVAPGNISTPGSKWSRMAELNPSGLACYLEENVPLKRLGNVTEIAYAVEFLLSKESGFITGSTLIIDGGQTRSI
jgi:3-oxoacyl-[acyl-carrier protein] reductase